jgi:hypothetical protein
VDDADAGRVVSPIPDELPGVLMAVGCAEERDVGSVVANAAAGVASLAIRCVELVGNGVTLGEFSLQTTVKTSRFPQSSQKT